MNGYNPRLNEINQNLSQLYPNMEDPIGEVLSPNDMQQTIMREQQLHQQIAQMQSQQSSNLERFVKLNVSQPESLGQSPSRHIVKVIDLVINIKLNIEV